MLDPSEAAIPRIQNQPPTGHPSPTNFPTRSPDRATAVASRNSPSFVSKPACTPRTDTPSPTATRTAHDPELLDRTAPATAPHHAAPHHVGREPDPPPPANTTRRRRPSHAPT